MLWSKILLIYDGSENALRATEYTAKMFGKVDGAQVTIFGLHEKLPKHDLKDTSPVVEKLGRQISSMEIEIERGRTRIQDAKKLLAKAGMEERNITVKFKERKHSVVKDVIEEAEAGGYGTLVIGRGETTSIVMAGGAAAREIISAIKDRVICVV